MDSKMNKFSKIVEKVENTKYFEVIAEVRLSFSSENEGEAGYRSDSILGSIEDQIDFTIKNISEIQKDEYIKNCENKNIENDI